MQWHRKPPLLCSAPPSDVGTAYIYVAHSPALTSIFQHNLHVLSPVAFALENRNRPSFALGSVNEAQHKLSGTKISQPFHRQVCNLISHDLLQETSGGRDENSRCRSPRLRAVAKIRSSYPYHPNEYGKTKCCTDQLVTQVFIAELPVAVSMPSLVPIGVIFTGAPHSSKLPPKSTSCPNTRKP